MGIIDKLIPKTIGVRILTPDKSHWEMDKAKTVPIEGVEGEVGGLERLLVLVKRQKVISKITPQLIKTFLGFREELWFYDDGLDLHPLQTKFENDKVGVEPVKWSHRFMINTLKTQMLTRYKDQSWWEKALPLIVAVLLVILSLIAIRSMLTGLGNVSDTIGERVSTAIIDSYKQIADSNVPLNAPKPTP